MKRGRLLLLMICSCCIQQVQAQWDAPVTRYWRVKVHYNPTFTGGEEEMKAEQQRIEQELLDFEQLIRKEEEVIASPPREAGRRANRKSRAFATILIA